MEQKARGSVLLSGVQTIVRAMCEFRAGLQTCTEEQVDKALEQAYGWYANHLPTNNRRKHGHGNEEFLP